MWSKECVSMLLSPPGSIMDACTTESTSMSSMLMCVSRGMRSDRVVEVEVICRDGSHELSETMDVEGGFSSTIEKVVAFWGPSSVRSIIVILGMVFFFLEWSGFELFGFLGLGLMALIVNWVLSM